MSYTILIIEDNVETCENLADILGLASYKLLVAHNGNEGIALAQANKPDLILCDVMMPGLDGYGVLHILGKDPETAGIPFIFLTAKSGAEDFRAGMNLGADDYLAKPFDGTSLLKVIETRLKKHDFIKTSFGNDIRDINEFFDKARELNDLQKLSPVRRSRTFKKKDFMFMEGQYANEVFFIQKGQIKIYKSSPDGKELIVRIHGDGEFVGFVPLLENSAYSESAVALAESEVYMISKDDFMTLIYSNKEIAKKFIMLLTNNLREAEHRLLDMAYQSVRQRVASVLVKMVTRPVNAKELITIARLG